MDEKRHKELKREEDIKLAQEADRVLGSPLVQGFIVAMKADLYGKLERTKFKETEERDEIWRKLQVLGAFEKHFMNFITTGKLYEPKMFERWFK